MKDIEISVVIPFYNAKEFVTQAVESALLQPETGEVLLIEDGSPDGGLEVCKRLAKEHPKVKLLQHSDRTNHGAAASRNLGIKNASFPFIAFLDADDYYLPNRFKQAVEVLITNEIVDGVYEAIGTFFQDKSLIDFFSTLPINEITTVKKEIKPEYLFEELVKLNSDTGYFSLDGFTVKKSLLIKAGLFTENLSMLEDTDIIIKLAAIGNLFPGNIISPVCMRRVHADNRITYHLENKRRSYFSQIKMWCSLYEWAKMRLSKDQQYFISLRYLERLRKIDYLDDFRMIEFIKSRKDMLSVALNTTELFLDKWFWRMVIPSLKLLNKRSLNTRNPKN